MVTELLWLLIPWWNARNIPGKLSETVHGARFAEVNAAVGCSAAQMGTRHAHAWMDRLTSSIRRFDAFFGVCTFTMQSYQSKAVCVADFACT